MSAMNEPTPPAASTQGADARAAVALAPTAGALAPAAASEQDPMRNVGYTVTAYALFLTLFGALLLLSRRRQRLIGARLGEIERSLEAAGRLAAPAGAPLVRARGQD